MNDYIFSYRYADETKPVSQKKGGKDISKFENKDNERWHVI